MSRTLLAFAVLLCILSLPVSADDSGPARPVADLAPGSTARFQSFSGFASIGSRSVFLRLDEAGRPALWVTDGTIQGTSAIAVLCPPCGTASLIGSTGSVAFYQVTWTYPQPGEMRIWRTDGTTAGTFPLMEGLGIVQTSSLAGGRLFFGACTRKLGCELWSSDGTAAGTAPVGEIVPGDGGANLWQVAASGDHAFLIAGVNGGPRSLWLASASSLRRLRETPRAKNLVLAGAQAFFLAEDDGWEVWTSNGTASGTRPLTSFEPRNPFRYDYLSFRLKAIAGRVYFAAINHGQEAELWSLGPRPESLRRLTNFSSRRASFAQIAKAGDRIVFGVRHGEKYVPELWASRDGSQLAAPVVCQGGCPTVESELVAVGGNALVFFGRNRETEGIWRTDGTGAGTRLLRETERAELYPYHELAQATAAGGRALFEIINEYEDGELWITDGTAAGTFFVTHGGPHWSHYYGWGGPLFTGTANGQLVFPGMTEDSFHVLWHSNGSPAGSQPLTQPLVGKSSDPRKLAAFGDLLLSQSCTDTEWQMRAVRGTETAVVLTRPLYSCDSHASTPIALPERAVFSLFDIQEGISVWATDGTPAGTEVLFPSAGAEEPQNVVRLGDDAAFWVWVPDSNGLGQFGSQLWLTDGTPAGTHKLFDLPKATEMYNLSASGGKLYFFDAELRGKNWLLRPWVSDGTLAGTHPLTEEAGLTPDHSFTDVDGTVFFRFNGVGEPTAIWSSDGTPAGTGPAITAASGMSDPEGLAGIQGRLFFAAHRIGDPSKLLLPWVSNGTDGSTTLLAEVELDSAFFTPQDTPPFTELDGRVYFAASEPVHGDELWVTDGTAEGTSLVRDIVPGPLGSYPRSLEAWRSRLYFRARDVLQGMELWTSDGTAEGTKLLQDILPGPLWSAPAELTATGESLCFSAYEDVHGRELWELPVN